MHFRLDRAMAWKDSNGALGASDALAANGDPRAKLAGLLAKLDQIDNGTRRGVANSERAQASTAQTIALAEGSLDQINKATNFAVDALKKANDFAGALDAATPEPDAGAGGRGRRNVGEPGRGGRRDAGRRPGHRRSMSLRR